jgi:hypothetical protein
MFEFLPSYGRRPWRELTRVNADLLALQRELPTSREVIQQHEQRIESQARVLRALWTLWRTHGITEEVLLEHVRQIRDQTNNPSPQVFTNCGKELRQLRNRCIYSGTERPAKTYLEAL